MSRLTYTSLLQASDLPSGDTLATVCCPGAIPVAFGLECDSRAVRRRRRMFVNRARVTQLCHTTAVDVDDVDVGGPVRWPVSSSTREGDAFTVWRPDWAGALVWAGRQAHR